MRRPKNVRLMKDAKRLVCASTYHVNIDHMKKSLNHLLLINDKLLIKDNADLVDRALSSSDKIACIAGICKSCKNLKKLDELNIEKLHCSKKCVADNEDCSAQNHTLKVSLFERTAYLHKDKAKKKLQLVNKVLTPAKFVDLLKTTVIGFPCHRFSVNHTSKTYDQAIAGMTDSAIVKIQDYTGELYMSFP